MILNSEKNIIIDNGRIGLTIETILSTYVYCGEKINHEIKTSGCLNKKYIHGWQDGFSLIRFKYNDSKSLSHPDAIDSYKYLMTMQTLMIDTALDYRIGDYYMYSLSFEKLLSVESPSSCETLSWPSGLMDLDSWLNLS